MDPEGILRGVLKLSVLVLSHQCLEICSLQEGAPDMINTSSTRVVWPERKIGVRKEAVDGKARDLKHINDSIVVSL